MRDAAFLSVISVLLGLVLVQPFAGVLLWSWISFMNPHRLVYGMAGEFPWAMIVFVCTLIGCLVANELRLPPMNVTTILILLLMVCLTLTSIAALGSPPQVWEKWEHVMKVLLGLLLTMSLLTTRRRIHALIWVIVISLGFYGVRGGIFTILTGGNYRVWGPPQTVIGDNNHLAAALLVVLPLMNYLRMQSAHRAVRIGLAIAMGLTLLATVGSYSRGALLGLAAVSLLLWLRSQSKLGTGIVLAAALAAGIAFMPQGWTDRMNSIGTYQEDASASERLVLWDISLRLALARPLTGSGFTGPYQRAVVDTVAPGGPARAVHSIWFEFLGEHGFPAFAIWLGLSMAGLWHSVRLTRMTAGRPELSWAHDLGRMSQASIAGYLVSGTFLSLSYWDAYWTILVVLAASHGLVMRAVTNSVAVAGVGMGAGWRGRLGPARAGVA